MSEDALDVYVEPVPEVRLSRRRHVTIADQDWQAFGDPASAEGTRERLRGRLVVNGVPVDLEVVSKGNDDDDPSAAEPHEQHPELRVQGRRYRLVGVFAIPRG